MSKAIEDLPIYLEWEPRAVSCSRGKFGFQTYDAEIRFLDKQCVVGTGFMTHEEAKASAQIVVDDMKLAIRKVGVNFLGGFKQAKP